MMPMEVEDQTDSQVGELASIDSQTKHDQDTCTSGRDSGLGISPRNDLQENEEEQSMEISQEESSKESVLPVNDDLFDDEKTDEDSANVEENAEDNDEAVDTPVSHDSATAGLKDDIFDDEQSDVESTHTKEVPEDHDDQEMEDTPGSHNDADAGLKDDIFDDEKSDEEATNEKNSSENPQYGNLFEDSDNSDDENKPLSSSKKKSPREKDILEGGDSASEEESVEGLKSKFKNGKKPEKKMRNSKQLRKQIHSDSQRMIRESRVKLPYHAPEAKPITFFLKRIPNLPSEKKKTHKPLSQEEVLDDSEFPAVTDLSKENPSLSDPQPEDTATQDHPKPVETSSTVTAEPKSPVKSKIKAVAALAGPPKLSMSSDPFFFDEPPAPKPKGMNQFIQRFMKHSVKAKPVKVENEKKLEAVEEPEQNSTQTKNVPLIVEGTVKTLKAPGSRLMFLKEKLSQKMKQQRAAQRKVWESQRKLDNEEFSEEEEEDMTDEESDEEINKWNEDDERKQKEREEEEEESKKSDIEEEEDEEEWPDEGGTEGSGSGDEAEDEFSDQEDSSITDKSKKSKRPFVQRMESTEATMDLFSSDNWSNQSSNTKDVRLRLDSAEESLHPELESGSVFTRLKDNTGSLLSELNTSGNNFKFAAPSDSTMDSIVSLDSKRSSEWNLESSMDSASIPPGQGERVRSNPILSRQTTPDIFTPFSRIQHLLKGDDIKEKIPKRLSDLSPPIEDSQDLLLGETYNTEDKPAPESPDSASQDFHFSLDDDTQYGEYLNTQGFLVSKKPKKPTASKALFGASEGGGTQSSMSELLGLCSGKFTKESNSENFFKPIAEKDSQGDMDELLGLCSGKFATTQKTQTESKGVITNTQQNMDELMGLCSGRFPTQATHSADSEGHKPTEEQEEENNEDDFDFGDDEDYGKPSKKSNVFSDDEGSEDGEQDPDSDNDDEEEEKEKDFDEMDEEEQALFLMSKKHKKFGKTYQNKKKFNKKNFLEDEAELSGSEAGSDENDDGNSDDDVYEEESEVEDLPSDEELQKQVNKVHLKTVMDQDKADLRTFQEMFLRDGDLYSDGRRKRNFRWAGIDDNSQLNLFNAGSDEEEEVVIETEEELQRRKQRHEKETYLMENRAKINEVLDLDESSQSILNLINDKSRSAPAKKVQKKSKVQTTPPKIVPVKKNPTSLSRRGSFLNLDKQKLSTLSAITANKRNVNVPARNFVFQSVSPSAPKKAKLQRSSSASEVPLAKRPCLERSMSSLPHSSVFSVMQQS